MGRARKAILWCSGRIEDEGAWRAVSALPVLKEGFPASTVAQGDLEVKRVGELSSAREELRGVRKRKVNMVGRESDEVSLSGLSHDGGLFEMVRPILPPSRIFSSQDSYKGP